MTLDDLVATMRDRFTASGGRPVMLTGEEWNLLGGAAVFHRDAVRELGIEVRPDDDPQYVLTRAKQHMKGLASGRPS